MEERSGAPSFGLAKPIVAFIATFVCTYWIVPNLKAHGIVLDDAMGAGLQGAVLSFLLWLTPHNVIQWIREVKIDIGGDTK